ncbi:hypothetical protein [Actinospongicola halichondriae]|uniref:hypothetical protein n=1 Tax=Actinospongicola halichondriae TaxID=3236844 RepID=UPI003D41FB59
MAWKGRNRRDRRDRGVALVEYALVLAILVVGSLGAIQTLEGNAAAEVDNQANCLSTRPPPSSCARAPLQPTTTTMVGQPTTTTPPAPTADVTAFSAETYTPDGDAYSIHLELVVRDDMDVALTGETVTIQWTITAASPSNRVGQFFYASCTVDGSGLCVIDFSTVYPEITEISAQVVSVGSQTSYIPDPCGACAAEMYTLP